MEMAGDDDLEMALDMPIEKYVIFKRKYQTSFHGMDPQMEITEQTINYVIADDKDSQLEASGLIRYILHTRPDPPFQQVIDAGVVPRFVQFLSREDSPNLQYEAVKILSIFAESSEHINVIVENDAIPGLVNLLNAPNELTRELAILTLGLIAGETPELCARVLENQALQPLLAQFEKDDKTEYTVQIAAWTLLQFCKGNPQLNSEMCSKVEAVILQLLSITSNTEEVIGNACWVLYCLSYVKIGEAQIVFTTRICSQLVYLLHHPSLWVSLPVLETLANIAASGVNILSLYMVDALKILSQLKEFIVRERGSSIKKAVCRIVANISQKHANYSREKINVVDTLFNESDVGVRTGVAWAISNITCNGSPQDIKNVVTESYIQLLCDMLDSSDTELGFNCLRGLERILDLWQEDFIDGESENVFDYIEMIEDVEGLQKIMNLRDLGHGLVSQTAQLILHNYWLDII